MKSLSQNRTWFLAVIGVTLITLGLLFAPAVEANNGTSDNSTAPWIETVAMALPDQQIFNEDFTIASGQAITEDVTVFRGNVEIEEQGSLTGDLSVFSGNVHIAGTLDGNLAVVGGDVDLFDTARISGDVSVVGGRLERSAGAVIGGNFVGGPRIQIEDQRPNQPEVNVRMIERGSSRPYILTFFLRLLQAILWTLLITGLVLLVRWLFPTQLQEIQKTGETQPALSFTVGLVVSLAAILFGGLLMITICLIPFALLIWALLAIVSLVGWAVLSVWLGTRLESTLRQRTGTELHPLIPVGIGALLLTGVTLTLWSVADCLGLPIAVLLGSTGTGAVLVHLARRTNFVSNATTASGFSSNVSGTATTGSQPSADTSVTVSDSMNPDVDPADTERDPSIDSSSDQPSGEGTVESATGVVEDEESTVLPPTEDATGFVTGEELGLSEEDRQQLQQGATGEFPPDDFTRILGIGPTFNRRLNEAGVTRFIQLAAMTPDQIAEILGWPPERVLRDQLREQAADLAGGS